MSYLELPRLHFFGTFKAAPSTINNIDANYQTDRPVPKKDLLWNPRGLAEFQILQGNEITLPPGATVVPTTVQSLQTSSGFITSGDPLIGQFVISTNNPSTGKLVDLDPDQQFVSQVWGMQIAIGAPGGEQVIGDYTAAYFQQIFWDRSVPGGPPSAAYQSLLTNLQWPSTITSPFLQKLRAASPDVLSIRFTLDRINLSTQNAQSVPNPNFTLGRIVGAIGPAAPSDPVFLNPRGRMLRPVPVAPGGLGALASVAAVPANTTAARPSIDQIRAAAALTAKLKAQPVPAPPEVSAAAAAVTAGTGGPSFTVFNYAPAIFDTSRNTVVIDLANTLQFTGNNPLQGGTITAAVATSGGLVPLGTVVNSLTNYQQRAFIFEFPITSSSTISAVQSNPIVIQVNGTMVLSENNTGAYVDATNHVLRMEANSSTTLSLFATIFGGPVGSGQTVTLGPAEPMNPPQVPPPQIVTITPNPVPLDSSGSGTFTITVGDPGNPRDFIDGQVYGIPIDWSLDTIPDSSNAFISVLVFDPYTEAPTWENVQPIFQQFMHLYPGMQSLMNLADQATVEANAPRIAGYLNAPITSSRHMPVTRDLSDAKRTVIVKYLDSI